MSKIYARLTEPDAGYKCDQDKVRDAGLELDKLYPVSSVEVNRSYTDVWLDDFITRFNSVHFDFEDEDGNPVDIYRMKEFWMYDFSD